MAAVAVTPPYLSELELSDLASRWPRPTSTSDKYSRGVVAIDTGSAAYPGAAVLGALGAVYSGAGYVKYVGPARAEVRAALPNVVCPSADSPLPRADAWLLGSGWGDRPDAATHVAAILAQGRPTVVDAEAIQCVTSATPAPVLLTPHSGELARLLGVPRDAVAADPVAAVQAACRRTGATILLKGATQYVATPGDAVTYLCFPGPAWTAQAGSGDVLAGIAATLLAAGLPPRDAALLAGSIQALTAARHPGPYPPQDLARFLPSAIASL
ncbi:MAG: NAD(P)H-hydrate dehydratase [Propionibacteriaceae bacterium]|nr:NAD(P)H-hydrate dehydratase [Propionibacteriaceae bacterium]